MWMGVLKDNQVYIIKFAIKIFATALKCLNLTCDGLTHVDVLCMASVHNILFMSGYQLCLINIKAVKCDFWKISVGCFVFLFNVIGLRGSEVALAFLSFLWFFSFSLNTGRVNSSNQSVAVWCQSMFISGYSSLIIPPLDNMIYATVTTPYTYKQNLTLIKIHWKFRVPIQCNVLYESVFVYNVRIIILAFRYIEADIRMRFPLSALKWNGSIQK